MRWRRNSRSRSRAPPMWSDREARPCSAPQLSEAERLESIWPSPTLPTPYPCLPPTPGSRCHWGLAEKRLCRCIPGMLGPQSPHWMSIRLHCPLLGPMGMVTTCCSVSAIEVSLAFSTPGSPAWSPPCLIILINVQRSATLDKYH